MKRIAIFVDGSNFKSSCDAIGLRPDYDKVVKYFQREGDVAGAYYFTALPPDEVDSPLRRVTDRLTYNGWTLKTKETKTYVDVTTQRMTVKGNMDIEICVQAFRMCEYVSDIVLFSGDGDFVSMVEEMQARAVRVTVVSILSRDGKSMISDDLRRQGNRFIDLKDMASEITLAERVEQIDRSSSALSFLRNK